MSIARTKFFCCAAALALLWGCGTPSPETVAKPSVKNDMPVGNFFRTAATRSQDIFDYRSAAKYYQNLYNRDADDMQALLGLVDALCLQCRILPHHVTLDATAGDRSDLESAGARLRRHLLAARPFSGS